VSMFAFLKRLVPASATLPASSQRPHPTVLVLEPLEDRQLLSVSVARYGGGGEGFAVDKLDGQVYAPKLLDPNGTPTGSPFLTQPGAVKAISAVNFAGAVPTLFGIGLDDQLYEQKFNSTTGLSTTPWKLAAPGQIKAISPSPFQVSPEVFVI